MLSVGRDVRLPEVLEVMVVGGRPASLHFGEDAATGFEVKDEVRADLCRQPDLASESHLLVEAELFAQQPSHDPLDIPTLGTMNMDDFAVRRCAFEMGSKTPGSGVDTSKFLLLGFRQGATRESL